MKPIDYSSFSKLITKKEITDFKNNNEVKHSSSMLGRGIIAALAIGVAATFFISFATSPEYRFTLLYFVVILVFGVIITRKYIERSWRISALTARFAKENGLSYIRRDGPGRQSGTIFLQGDHKQYKEIVRSDLFEMGDYSYVTGSGKNSQKHDWGYIALNLSQKMPQMLLDAKSNNVSILGEDAASNLMIDFASREILQLEGDFNTYFTLYVPREYHADAYYIFTPDVMALLVDFGANWDIEVHGFKLYIYSSPFADNGEDQYRKAFEIIELVGNKLQLRMEKYIKSRQEIPESKTLALKRKLMTDNAIALVIVGGFSIFTIGYMFYMWR